MGDDDKRENHWYLVGITLQAAGNAMKPRASALIMLLVAGVGLAVALQTGLLERLTRGPIEPTLAPVASVVLVSIALAVAFFLRWQQRAEFEACYRKALVSDTPQPLIRLIEGSMAILSVHPDVDALAAQSKAAAYALYGREAEAAAALAVVDWNSKSPMVRATGLYAEGLLELLCRRDAGKALELARAARAMSSVSSRVPGSAQSARYYEVSVAVGEVLRNLDSAKSLEVLEAGAANPRYLPLQLLASFGLAAALERSGNAQRAAALRAFIHQTAPHCAPLHLPASAFASTGERVEAPPRVPLSIPPASEQPRGAQARSAQLKLALAVAVIAGMYALYFAMDSVLRTFIAPPK